MSQPGFIKINCIILVWVYWAPSPTVVNSCEIIWIIALMTGAIFCQELKDSYCFYLKTELEHCDMLVTCKLIQIKHELNMEWYDAVGRSMMQYDENMQDKATQLLGTINKTASQCNEYGWVIKFNTLRPRQNGCRFADDVLKGIFLNENVWILIKISLKFVPKGPTNNIPALVQIMAWCRSGDKPLSEPMTVSLMTHICVTRPQWVNSLFGIANIGVHIVHTSRIIITYTLESLSSHTKITHSIQTTIHFEKKDIKKETQKSEGTH